MATQIIDGKKYTKSRSYDRKAQAQKLAERLRKDGYLARVISKTSVKGRVKNAKGKTTKVIKGVHHYVAYRKK